MFGKNITYDKTNNCLQVSVTINGERIHKSGIGTPADAVRVYNEIAVQHGLQTRSVPDVFDPLERINDFVKFMYGRFLLDDDVPFWMLRGAIMPLGSFMDDLNRYTEENENLIKRHCQRYGLGEYWRRPYSVRKDRRLLSDPRYPVGKGRDGRLHIGNVGFRIHYKTPVVLSENGYLIGADSREGPSWSF